MKQLISIALLSTIITYTSCNTAPVKNDKISAEITPAEQPSEPIDSSYDPAKGEGRFTNVKVSPTLNTAMAENGKKVYHARCESCHDLSADKRVGPGLKGITTRHTPEWFMNFMTNTDVMLDKDPFAKEQLKKYKIRMGNQYLGDEDVRDVYEFLRKNDGIK
ncbi:cytochrome c [Danxiaibacter flavus]|uniref:Cytochrome c n=1 Tax=Danxiaibacter flavus TaxID=3049108 RepID=A0ABV3ZAP9_9BACT|nr:cytochrome c [Chitinophagaceae bacterium DXS]